MLSSKNSIINKNLFIATILSIILSLNLVLCDEVEYNRTNGESCSVNLHCNSGCCSSDICQEIDHCSTTKIYIIQAIVCIALVAAFTIYLIPIKLKNIKQDFEKKKNNMGGNVNKNKIY